MSYIISLFTYIQRVRFGSRVRQEGKKIFQLRKSWLLCLTLTLSHYQDYIYFLSQVFWWRNDKILCSGKKKKIPTQMLTKLSWNMLKTVWRENVARESTFSEKTWRLGSQNKRGFFTGFMLPVSRLHLLY